MAQCSLVTASSGHCIVDLKVENNLYRSFKFSVLPNLCCDVILGGDFMKLHEGVEFAFDGPRPKLTVCGVTCMTVEPPSLFPNLPPDCKPITTSTRHHSTNDEVFIRGEIQTLLREGVIEESQSPWRVQVLVTSNERHRRRMVIDYSRTINKYTPLDAYPIPRIHDLVHELAKYSVFSKLDLKSAYYQVPLIY